MKPQISILLPVKNGASVLAEAIDSLLRQTFPDWELLAIDDGSTDSTAELIAGYSDKRIRLIKNDRNIGVAASLNRAEAISAGEYIARMDADDIALPERLAQQYQFLESHPNVALCGTAVETFGGFEEVYQLPRQHSDIRALLFLQPSLMHPTVMWRRKSFREKDLHYQENPPTAEDYELWVRATEKVQFANLPQILLRYRVDQSIKDSPYLAQQKKGDHAIKTDLLRRLGLPVDEDSCRKHKTVSLSEYDKNEVSTRSLMNWMREVVRANDERKVFEPVAFRNLLTQRAYWLLSVRKVGIVEAYRHFTDAFGRSKRWMPYLPKLLAKRYLKRRGAHD